MVELSVLLCLCGFLELSRAGLISLKPRSAQNVTSRCEENSKSPMSCRNVENPGTALPHPDDCHLFYYCEQPYLPPVCKECPDNLLFNPVINVCDWYEHVDCQVVDTTTKPKTSRKPVTEAETNKTSQTIMKLTPEKEESIETTRCESYSIVPVSCASVHSSDALIPHPDDCQLFYYCVAADMEPACKQCPHNLHFNPATQVCDWPATAGCNTTKKTDATTTWHTVAETVTKSTPPTSWTPATVKLSKMPQTTIAPSTANTAATSKSVPLTPNKDSEDSEEGPSRCELNSKNAVSCTGVQGAGGLMPHPDDCQLFYYCVAPDAKPVCKQCPHNLHFNPATQVCDWPATAGCNIIKKIDSTTTRATVVVNYTPPTTWVPVNVTKLSQTPKEVTESTTIKAAATRKSIPLMPKKDTEDDESGLSRCELKSKNAVSCTGVHSVGGVVPHPDDCQLFYYCVGPDTEPVCKHCPHNLHYNPTTQVCDWPATAGCNIAKKTELGTQTTTTQIPQLDTSIIQISETTTITTTIMDTKSTASISSKTHAESIATLTSETDTATTRGLGQFNVDANKEQLSIEARCERNSKNLVSCADMNNPDNLIPHPDDCQLFYYCADSNSPPVCRGCPANMHFNPSLHVCDWPTQAGCNKTTTKTESSVLVPLTEAITKQPDNNAAAILTPEMITTSTVAVTSQADTNGILIRCTKNSKTTVSCENYHGSDSLVPHPDDCQLFYYCVDPNLPPICRQCPANLHFNPSLHVCDWPARAGCNITEIHDSTTWATVTETIVKPTIPTTWTPATITTVSLLPEKVTEKSTTKVSLTTETVSLAPEKDPVTTATSATYSDTTKISETETSTSTNKQLSRCELSSKSPVLCAEVHSPDALVPHPDDCQLFYHCEASDKEPVCKECPHDLHFNPASHVCDWPATAGCNITANPDSTTLTTVLTTLPTTWTPATITTVSLMPDKVTESSTAKVSFTTETVSLAPEKDPVTTATSPTISDTTKISETETSTSTNKQLSRCELNSKSPVSCAEVHSPDALVPHPDDCQLFYYCVASDMEPICKQCPDNLHFNPVTHVCDWPATAGCNVTAKPDSTTLTTVLTTLPTTWTAATITTVSLLPEKVTESSTAKVSFTTETVSLAPEKDPVTTATSPTISDTTKISETETSTSTNKQLSRCELNSKSPVSCAEVHSPDALVPHPDDCQLFYYCVASDMEPICKQCPDNLHFNPVTHVCDWPATAGCNVTAKPDSTTLTTVLTTLPTTWTAATITTVSLLPEKVTESSTAKVSFTTETVSLAPEKDPVTTATSATFSDTTKLSETEISTSTNKQLSRCELSSKSPVSCAEVHSPDALVPHPDDCQLFYHCEASDKEPVCKECPHDLHFNPASHVCDWPATAGCNITANPVSTTLTTVVTALPTTWTPATITTVSLMPEKVTESSTTKVSLTTETVSLAPEKDPVTTATSATFSDTTKLSETETSTSTNKQLSRCELNSKSPVLCAEVHSPDALVPHPDDCQLFYYCVASDMEPICKQCPDNLHFNPVTHVCDWPATAGCNVTAKPDSTTLTTVLTTLPTTWTPATITTVSLLPEKVTEKSTTKVSLTTETGSLAPEKDPVTTATSATYSDTTKISETETSTSTNKQLSRCELSSKSPVLCAEVHSPDALVPHPDDCQLFYHCEASDKEPVCKECPHDLHFNPASHVCDWPATAGCNITANPDSTTLTTVLTTLPTTWTPATITTVSLMPEKVTESSTAKVSFTTETVALASEKDPVTTATSATFSDTTKLSETEISTSTNKQLSRCELNSKSPVLCAEVHSPDALVPHPDDCQLFYYCVASDMEPICKQCPDNLHFNPVTHVCDWPATAGCNVTAKPDSTTLTTVLTTLPTTWTPATITTVSLLPEKVTEKSTTKVSLTTETGSLAPEKDPVTTATSATYSDTTKISETETSTSTNKQLSRCELSSKSPVLCAEVHSPDALVPHPDDCQLFYHCEASDKEPVCKECPHDLHFNPASHVCDWPATAGCNITANPDSTTLTTVLTTLPTTWTPATITTVSLMPEKVTESSTAKVSFTTETVALASEKDPVTTATSATFSDTTKLSETEISTSTNKQLSRCELNSKSPVLCAEVHSLDALVPHPDDCQLFYYCVASDMEPICKQCPDNLHFNPVTHVCDWPATAGCNITANPDSTTLTTVLTTLPTTWTPATITTVSLMPEKVTESSTTKVSLTTETVSLAPEKDPVTTATSATISDTNKISETETSTSTNKQLSRCELNSKSPVLCAEVHSPDALVPHPDDCQLFYYCVASDMEPICKQCPDNLHFNPVTHVCDWPATAGCKINANPDSTTLTTVLTTLPTTWTPATITTVSLMPEKVTESSTAKVSFTTETVSLAPEKDPVTTATSATISDTNKISETETSTSTNKQLSRCELNSKSPVLCAEVHSPDALVPHPDDCQLFYYCVASDMEPICKQCPDNLHFNPVTHVCDWPATAGCNVTAKPDSTTLTTVLTTLPTTWTSATITTVSLMPEKVTESSTAKVSFTTETVSLAPEKYPVTTATSATISDTNKISETETSTSTNKQLSRCELNSKSPVLCAEVHSPDALVPHPDDCQLFYYCVASDMEPICKQCPDNLHFNPVTNVCDWPATAGCKINANPDSTTLTTVLTTLPTTWTPATITTVSLLPEKVTESSTTKVSLSTEPVSLAPEKDPVTTATSATFSDTTKTSETETSTSTNKQLSRCELNSKSPVSCAEVHSPDALVPHPDDCQLFYYCVATDMEPICKQCPDNLHFNPVTHVCDWPATAGCNVTAKTLSTKWTTETTITSAPKSITNPISHFDSTIIWTPAGFKTKSFSLEKTTESVTLRVPKSYNGLSLTHSKASESFATLSKNKDKSETNVSTSSNEPLTLCERISKSPVSCAKVNSSGALIPHPNDCQLFYYCVAQDVEPVCKQCPNNLHFNSASLVCDWPTAAGCKFTSKSDSATKRASETSTPQLPTKRTSHFDSTITSVPAGLETLSSVIATTKVVSLTPNTASEPISKFVKGTGASETRITTSSNKPLTLCEYNTKSPVSCAEVHSPDGLVPHPDDCQLFYYCLAPDVEPICKQCPNNLHFNPASLVCDWPSTAGCNITKKSDSATKLVYETTVSSTPQVTSKRTSHFVYTTTWAPATIATISLEPEIATESPRPPETNTRVSLIPEKDTQPSVTRCELNSKSPISCAEVHNQYGVIAHPDDCQLFYICQASQPICKQCPDNLHFNPTLLVCDWPATAGCNITSTISATQSPKTTTPAVWLLASKDKLTWSLNSNNAVTLPSETVSFATSIPNSNASPTLIPDTKTTARFLGEPSTMEVPNVPTLCERKSKTPVSCADALPDTLLQHPDDCQLFYSCLNQDLPPVCRECPAKLHFNPKIQACDWPGPSVCKIKGL